MGHTNLYKIEANKHWLNIWFENIIIEVLIYQRKLHQSFYNKDNPILTINEAINFTFNYKISKDFESY